MSHISIVSITGNIINDKTPFIIVNITNPGDLLYKKYENKEIAICGISNDKVNNILKKNNVQTIFVSISDIILNKSKNESVKILLVNKFLTISKVPTLYEKIMKIGKGFVWKPVSVTFPSIFTSLGLVYSLKKPVAYGRIIDANYLINSDDIINNFETDHLVVSNEYYMFVTDYDDRKTINKQKLMYTNFTMLYEKNDGNEYVNISDNEIKKSDLVRTSVPVRENMTNIKDSAHTLVPGDIMYSPLADDVIPNSDKPTLDNIGGLKIQTNKKINSHVHFLPDGRVEIDKNDNGDISTVDCVDTPVQQWQFNDGNIIHRNSGKCLSTEQPFVLSECNTKKSGSFIDSEEPDVKFPKWHKKFGKNVVLVSSDNPWYINTNTTIPVNVSDYKNPNLNYTDYSRDFGVFKEKNLKKLMKTQPDKGVEFFEGDNKKDISSATNKDRFDISIYLFAY
jgi:hypothetical protein